MPLFEVERIGIEVVSAIACFILVRFMVKPFQLSGETRYLGLPLGFGFLGISYTFSAVSYSPLFDFQNWGEIQLFLRMFAFLFLTITYYFSKSSNQNGRSWNITLGLLGAILAAISIVTILSPQISRSDYILWYMCVRVVNLVCLCYISIHALKSHLEQRDPKTLTAPFGYILLAISQYSAIIWVVESSYISLFGGLSFRLAGLAVFLYVSYLVFSAKKPE